MFARHQRPLLRQRQLWNRMLKRTSRQPAARELPKTGFQTATITPSSNSPFSCPPLTALQAPVFSSSFPATAAGLFPQHPQTTHKHSVGVSGLGAGLSMPPFSRPRVLSRATGSTLLPLHLTLGLCFKRLNPEGVERARCLVPRLLRVEGVFAE